MTNEEAIKELKFLKKVDFHIDTKEACDIAINSIQENTKFKAEIERLNSLLTFYMDKFKGKIEYNYECLKEIEQLKAEIDRLNTQIVESNQEGVSILHDILELREENERLKKEIENLLVDKECWTCKHEELSPLSEPCYSCDDCANWERKEQVSDEV